VRRYREGFGGLLADIHQAFRFEFAGILFAVGILLMFFALVGYIPQLREWARGIPFLDNIIAGMGGWIFWETIIAVLVMLIGAFDFYDTVKKIREFEKLMQTTSKEIFLKNRKRIKDLAENDLPERYWHRVVEKELELKV